MSGAKVSNHDLGVATKTSGHEAHAGPPDVCLDPSKKVPSPHPNIAPTSRATEHTTGKTKFQEGQVVRVGDAIGPQSDPAHPDLGGGVVSQTYRFEARAGKGSPEIRAESKPPTRTTDTTTQNHANTTGKMVIPASPNSLADAADDALKTCSYEKSTIKCSHKSAVKLAQILVLRGDTITIVANRINAKKSGDAVACHQPTHMKWRVLRTGGLDRLGNALPKKDEEKTGDTLTLDEAWTGPGEAILGGKVGHTDGGLSTTMSDSAKQRLIDQKNTFAQSNAVVRGASRVENQDGRLAYQQIAPIKAANAQADLSLNNARRLAHVAIDVARFAREWRADQNPVRIQITGAACSGGVSYEVIAYPPHSFEFKFPLDKFRSVGRTFGRAMGVIGKIGKLGGVEVENSLQCPGSDFDVTITFKWEEIDGATAYDIQRSGGISIGGTFFKWTFDIGVPHRQRPGAHPHSGRGGPRQGAQLAHQARGARQVRLPDLGHHLDSAGSRLHVVADQRLDVVGEAPHHPGRVQHLLLRELRSFAPRPGGEDGGARRHQVEAGDQPGVGRFRSPPREREVRHPALRQHQRLRRHVPLHVQRSARLLPGRPEDRGDPQEALDHAAEELR